jgi:hypothetical protein
MRWMSVPIALIAGLLFVGDAAAQDWRELVLRQLDKGGETVRTLGQTDANILSRNQVIGMLKDGGTSYFEVSLEGGISYLFTGACDQDCSDLDLRLVRSADFEVVESDVETDDVPVIIFTAPSTALYLVGVDMADCSEDICYFGFRSYQQ